nr:hypothetical protein [Chitinophagaceae bacterium]
MRSILFCIVAAAVAVAGCRSSSIPEAAAAQVLSFRLRTGAETGLQFSNRLQPTAAFNVFNYMYFYN